MAAKSRTGRARRDHPRRCRRARARRILSIALITAGLVVLADVGLTLAYREPISSIYGSIEQGQARDQLADLESHYPTPPTGGRAAPQDRGGGSRSSPAASRAQRRRGGDRPIESRMDDLDAVIVQGTDTGELQKGPGHYPQTPFPGSRAPWQSPDTAPPTSRPSGTSTRLRRGDKITLEMPYATLRLPRPEDPRSSIPSDVGVVRPAGYDRLVLTACHPLYSAAHRFIAFARLRRVSRATGS